MTIYFVTGLILCAVAVLFVAVRGRRNQAKIRPLDMAAFRALMDREDELFLREKLSRVAFFRLKRKRIRVSLQYVGRIAGNAAAAMRLSDLRRDSANPEVAEAAAQIVSVATQLRIQCLMAFAKLSLEFAFPTLQLTPATLAPKYQSLRANLSKLAQMQPQDKLAMAAAS